MMADYYALERPLTINKTDGTKIDAEPGIIVLTEATGELSTCDPADLETNIARIDADIVARDIAIAEEEAQRLIEEQAAQEEEPIEP